MGGSEMLNRAVIVGRLTRDPDLRYTPSGLAVSNFTVAANRPFKNQQGEQEADFIGCVAWRKQAENLANYMKKGQMIGVDGRIQTRNYKAEDGKTVYVTEVLAESIQFLEPKRNGGQQQSNNYGQMQNNHQYQQAPPIQESNSIQQEGEEINIEDPDLPF